MIIFPFFDMKLKLEHIYQSFEIQFPSNTCSKYALRIRNKYC